MALVTFWIDPAQNISVTVVFEDKEKMADLTEAEVLEISDAIFGDFGTDQTQNEQDSSKDKGSQYCKFGSIS